MSWRGPRPERWGAVAKVGVLEWLAAVRHSVMQASEQQSASASAPTSARRGPGAPLARSPPRVVHPISRQRQPPSAAIRYPWRRQPSRPESRLMPRPEHRVEPPGQSVSRSFLDTYTGEFSISHRRPVHCHYDGAGLERTRPRPAPRHSGASDRRRSTDSDTVAGSSEFRLMLAGAVRRR